MGDSSLESQVELTDRNLRVRWFRVNISLLRAGLS